MTQVDQNELRRRLADDWVRTQAVIEAFVLSAIPLFHDAEDVIQATAQQIALSYESYDPQRPFAPWALQIAKKQIARHYEKRSREHKLLDSQLLDAIAKVHDHKMPPYSDEAEALQHCLHRLQAKAQDLLRLRYESDMKPARIAELLSTTSGSIRVTL